MASKMPNNMPNGGASAGNSEMKEFFIQHGMVMGIILLVVVIAVIVVVRFHGSRTQANAAQAELLGPALAYEYTGKKDSALAEYDRLLAGNELSGETLAKAALLAGNIRFQNSMPLRSFTRKRSTMRESCRSSAEAQCTVRPLSPSKIRIMPRR